MGQRQINRLGGNERLLLHVIEQFSRPLLQLNRLAELAQVSPEVADWKLVEDVSAASLQLAEGYSLSLRLQGKLSTLELEPLAVSSLLYDAAQDLSRYAHARGVALELDTGPRLAPVLGDRMVLASVLTNLGQVFIDAGAESEPQQGHPVTVYLSAHRSRHGVVTGLYSSIHDFSTTSLRQAHQLQGRARQPLQRLVTGPAAGVFVADSLLETLQSHLHVARYHKLTGLAATLMPSQQLSLV